MDGVEAVHISFLCFQEKSFRYEESFERKESFGQNRAKRIDLKGQIGR